MLKIQLVSKASWPSVGLQPPIQVVWGRGRGVFFSWRYSSRGIKLTARLKLEPKFMSEFTLPHRHMPSLYVRKQPSVPFLTFLLS
jgi:hypothetical protein